MPGTDIDKLKEAIEQAEARYEKLVLLIGESGSGKTQLLRALVDAKACPLVNVNLRLSQKLLEIPRRKRPAKVSTLFSDLLDEEEGSPILLDDIELLFDKALQTNTLTLLRHHSKNRIVVVAWNGTFSDGVLTYAEPDHPEYVQEKDVEAIVLSIASPAAASH
ncbi:hypothetical protein Mal52_59080 [Symmachiella dynata]|uniref:ATPase AAA-type core domain-containing protein n=1 Tax=Symmachiella dynata TaxID=2527995 RepID=A0A517ZY31_9PLAN|nr:BREX-3 system P-loop-containing protein BrxF [Symmachiella dynata]QDU47379.1 hypothetical protein Mal52_59080 [Symmachiella dynata]